MTVQINNVVSNVIIVLTVKFARIITAVIIWTREQAAKLNVRKPDNNFLVVCRLREFHTKLLANELHLVCLDNPIIPFQK
jgi:hypothetical protein